MKTDIDLGRYVRIRQMLSSARNRWIWPVASTRTSELNYVYCVYDVRRGTKEELHHGSIRDLCHVNRFMFGCISFVISHQTFF